MALDHPSVPVSVVIFDFDGLLMDTESTSLQSWQYEWRQWELELDPTTFFAAHGGDVTDQRYAELGAAVGPHFDRELSHRRRTAYRDALHTTLELGSGIADWLADAVGLGLRLAVASSSPSAWVSSHLARVGALEQFSVIATGDEVTRHKPAPDVYRLAMRRLELSNGSTAVAVEDTPHGIRAARSAGLRTIAIPNPHVDPAHCSDADLVLRSAADRSLAAALESLGP